MLRRLILLLTLALLPQLAPPSAAAQAEVTAAGGVRVVHTPRQRLLAREVLAAATRPMTLPGFGRGTAPESTTIVLAASPAAWTEATGGLAPEWAGGIAFPFERVIVLPTYPSAAVREAEAAVRLRHELVHLALHERLKGQVPRWFDEGYAELASGGWDTESAWQLRLAFLLGRVPPLDSLSLAWPVEANRARFAYLLSATAVEHLSTMRGEEGFRLLLENWQREGDFDRAIRTTFGMTAGQFEDDWRKAVRRRYGWLLAASSVTFLWLLASLLALVAWLPRRRRNRVRLDAMRAEERMLPPPTEESAAVEYPVPEPWPGDER